jgi:cold shock protein
MSSASSSVTSAPVRLTGRVKWFNNKTGFGFISVVGGNDQYKDASEVFVHHSAVTVSQEQYRYLVEGEYVEFSVVTTESGDHKFQAGDVRGVKGGKLFCETRHEHRASQDGGAGAGEDKGERGRPQVRGRGGGGRGGRVDGGGRGGRVDGSGAGRGGSDWMLVRRDSRGHERGRGRSEEYSQRPARSEKSSSHAQTPAPATPPPAPAKQEVSSVGDVPATPRAVPKKTPRQAKPSV